MRERRRRRVDWDEEIRKTERIRRKGLFTSVLSFGVVLIFAAGAGRMNEIGVEIGRKIIFAFCFVAAMFLFRAALRRRARLSRERKKAGSGAEAGLRIRSSSEEETLRLGRTLGASLVPGLTVLLSGELGTGKTVLVRGVGDALGVARVRSPSFTLVNEYRTEKFLLAHADLYRLEPGGAGELGLEEYAGEDCVLFVEWPDRWKTPPGDVLNVAIEAVGETERLFGISARGQKAEAVCRILKNETLKSERAGETRR